MHQAAIGPYSQGIICNGIAFFSGQIPLSPITGEVVGTTIEEQTEQVMLNIKALLEARMQIYRCGKNNLFPCRHG